MGKSESSYYDAVWELCRQVPEGRVTSYGAIADALALGSARMVGWALRQSSHAEFFVPAHRVVNRNGELTGRMNFETPTIMQERLEAEGIPVEDNKVVDFDKYFWSPLEIIDD